METIEGLIAERLRCPICAAAMRADPSSGGFVCENAHVHGLGRGYLDATNGRPVRSDTSTARTFASFGYEWNAFDEVRAEDEKFARIYFRDLDLDSLNGLVGLDAGCGKGRFTRFLAEHLRAVVALDGSDAVEAAARNLRGFSNVLVVKSDLRAPPFAPESFDFVACLGVLHHLEDPHEGFTSLVGKLSAGGRVLIYVYSKARGLGMRSVAQKVASGVRKVSVVLPHKLLKVICVPIASVLYFTFVLPGRVGERRRMRMLSGLPMETYRDKPWRSLLLDTFDRLSAPVEHRFEWSDISWWFDEAGLVVDSAREETGWFVLAHRP